MFVVCVTIRVKPEHRDEFVAATLENCRGTRSEPGNFRFDLLENLDNPDQFFLYEAYRAKDDFKRHQQTAHYSRWKETVSDWMAGPRVAARHRNLFPTDAEWYQRVP